MEGKMFNNNSFTIKQFSWAEKENIKAEELFDFVNSTMSNFYNVYLFVTFNCGYPVPFSIKHLGLWKSIIKRYDINVYYSNEKKLHLSSYGVFYGASRVSLNKQVFELLLDYNRNSWLLFANKEYDLDFLIENFVQASEKHMEILSRKIVNYFCEKGEDIVFLIDGSGESALYIIQGHQRKTRKQSGDGPLIDES